MAPVARRLASKLVLVLTTTPAVIMLSRGSGDPRVVQLRGGPAIMNPATKVALHLGANAVAVTTTELVTITTAARATTTVPLLPRLPAVPPLGIKVLPRRRQRIQDIPLILAMALLLVWDHPPVFLAATLSARLLDCPAT